MSGEISIKSGTPYKRMFRSSTSKAWFKLADIVSGRETQRSLKSLLQSQYWNHERLSELQNRKLAVVLDAMKRFSHILNLPESIEKTEQQSLQEHLQKYPVLEKSDVRGLISQYLESEISRNHDSVAAHTSGSSGEPLKIYRTKKAHGDGWAATVRAWSWAGYSIGDPISIIGIHRPSVTHRFWNRVSNTNFLSVYGLSEETAESYLRSIESHGSEFIRGYGSAIFILASFQDRLNLDIRLKNIMTTGETLYDFYRKKIEDIFDCEVFDGYGSNEVNSVAFECEMHNGYHITAENCIAEILEANNQTKAGRLVLTDLCNPIIPIVRYSIGDLAYPMRGNDDCDCGRNLPMLGGILGRDTDIITTIDGRFLIVHFFTVFFEKHDEVNQFRIVQLDDNIIEVELVVNESCTQDHLKIIEREISEYAGPKTKIQIKLLDEIPAGPRGKRRFMIANQSVESVL